MQQLHHSANPFALMLDPQAVFARIEHSGGLQRLSRRVCRPLDKPLLGVARGARVDARSPNGTTALMMAARYGPEDAVQALLQKGADPRLRNDLDLGAADFARQAGREKLSASLAQLAR